MLIDSDSLLKKFESGALLFQPDVRKVIESEPEAIIRCKDCEWWDRIDDGSYGYCHACKHGFYSGNWEISIYRIYKEDFFCGDGERRNDEQTK